MNVHESPIEAMRQSLEALNREIERQTTARDNADRFLAVAEQRRTAYREAIQRLSRGPA